jgi:hypothetical protein
LLNSKGRLYCLASANFWFVLLAVCFGETVDRHSFRLFCPRVLLYNGYAA